MLVYLKKPILNDGLFCLYIVFIEKINIFVFNRVESYEF